MRKKPKFALLMHLFNEWVDSVHLSEWSVHESADSMKQTLVNSLLEEKISVNDVIVTQSYCIPLEDYRPQTEQKSTSMVLLHPFWNLKDSVFSILCMQYIASAWIASTILLCSWNHTSLEQLFIINYIQLPWPCLSYNHILKISVWWNCTGNSKLNGMQPVI